MVGLTALWFVEIAVNGLISRVKFVQGLLTSSLTILESKILLRFSWVEASQSGPSAPRRSDGSGGRATAERDPWFDGGPTDPWTATAG